MSKVYALADEPFRTIQGEGRNAGRAAVFVRFAGCNLWSGHDEHRERDAARHKAQCPAWCDTDFRPKHRLTRDELVKLISEHADTELVVFTGGEPLLHIDAELLEKLHEATHDDYSWCEFAVETNGTVNPSLDVRNSIDHICCSPKVPPERMKLRSGDELKVVYPAYDPNPYMAAVDAGDLDFGYLYVQPQAYTEGLTQISGIVSRHVVEASQFVIENPRWRLSYQLHKAIGVP